jgi:hypothetical protein
MWAGRVRLLADGDVPRGSHEQQNLDTLLRVGVSVKLPVLFGLRKMLSAANLWAYNLYHDPQECGVVRLGRHDTADRGSGVGLHP